MGNKEVMHIALNFVKCAASVGSAAGSAGANTGAALNDCVTFMASVAKQVVKSFKDAVIVMPDPPLFANELQWTKEYVDEVKKKLGRAHQHASNSVHRETSVLARTTLGQLTCVVTRMTEYTTDPGNRGGAEEEGVTKLADIEKFQAMEKDATEVLHELQRKMLSILQVKLLGTTQSILKEAKENHQALRTNHVLNAIKTTKKKN
jgi:hypothetical protein